MKKNFIKIGALSVVFALGLGLIAINGNKQQENAVYAANQHIANFDPYSYEGSYYDTVDVGALSEGLDGSLRTKLTTLIAPSQWYTYSGSGESTLSYRLQYADEDPTNPNNMIYFYSRDSVKKNAASSWNREHVWPQSKSNGNYGENKAGADILHIRPTYNQTNSTRGSLLMGDTGKETTLTYDGMTYGYKGGSMFEPLDSVKGDVARIFMYVWTAYKNIYSSKPMDLMSVIESYDTLLKWHMEDKPDVSEGNRNNYAQSTKQGNRNPFVDHPEYAWMIFGDSASAAIKEQCQEAYPINNGVPKTLVGISISGEATKKEYEEGESFNPSGLTVTAYYTSEEGPSTKDVPLSSCTWTPDPLTEGVTEVTCAYNGFTATYSGITVTKTDVPPVVIEGDAFKVTFRSASAGGNSAMSASAVSNEFESNTLIDTVTSATQIYTGTAGIRIGSRNNPGSLVFKLKQEAQKNIQSIQVKCSKYNESDTGILLVKYDNQEITTSSDSIGVDFTKTFYTPVNATTMTVGTKSSRTLVKEIIVTVKGDEPIDPPPSSSSSLPPSSSSSSSSSSSISSNPQSSSSISSSISSSSLEESSSLVPSTTSIEQSSSSEINVSSSEETTIVPSSSEVTSTSQEGNKDNNKKGFGCGGSVTMVLPLTGFSALIGLVFIFSKKKKN